MPSHIFLQLGMWPEAAASNESAWEASDAWMKRKNLSPSVRDYHSLHWLLYVYLQQGRYRKAEELLTLMKKTMSETNYENKLRPGYYENNYANMAAAFVVETERWNLASTLFPAPADRGQTSSRSISSTAAAHGGHGGASAGFERWARDGARFKPRPEATGIRTWLGECVGWFCDGRRESSLKLEPNLMTCELRNNRRTGDCCGRRFG